MALEMEYLLSSDEMQSQRSTVLPPIAMSMEPMSSMSISAEPHDTGEGASPLDLRHGYAPRIEVGQDGQEPLGTRDQGVQG